MANDYKIPNMIPIEELSEQLSFMPKYDDSVREKSSSERLIELNDIYKAFYPFSMAREIYTRMYLAFVHSMSKKRSINAVKQTYANHGDCRGIIGMGDCFATLANSGMGKSSSVSRAIELIGNNIIELEQPYQKIKPFLTVQCPFDSSVKGMLLEILQSIDSCFNTDYYQSAQRGRATTDNLIGMISQICLNDIGVLIIDEIQNIIHSKSGMNIIGCLTQIINSSGIAVIFVGTLDAKLLFQQTFFLARRTVGLEYGAMEYDEEFRAFCRMMLTLQYTRNYTEITESIINFLYEHSGGIIAVVVQLIHDAQEIAILDGSETLNIASLGKAYKQRMGMLSTFIKPQSVVCSAVKKNQIINNCEIEHDSSDLISRLSQTAIDGNLDAVNIISQQIIIEQVDVKCQL